MNQKMEKYTRYNGVISKKFQKNIEKQKKSCYNSITNKKAKNNSKDNINNTIS